MRWPVRALSLCAVLGVACTPGRRTVAPANATGTSDGGVMSDATQDEALKKFAASFLAGSFAQWPTDATKAGDHSRDGDWPDVSVAGDAARRAFYEGAAKTAGGFDASKLGLQSQVDLAIVKNQIGYALFSADELKELDWNPLAYVGLVGDGLDPLLTRSFAPLEERMKSMRVRLQGIPAIVAAAKKRLAHPPAIYTETAIQQNKGLVALCKDDLAKTKVGAGEAELHAAALTAAAALEDFQVFLEKDLLSRSDGDFRLGRTKLAKKMSFELGDDVSIDQLADDARALLRETQLEMVETARELWPAAFPGEKLPAAGTRKEQQAFVARVLGKVAEKHPTNATILGDAKKLLADATQFVAKHDLVRIPEQPCDVIEMPEYRRGVAVAYCDASGPLEKKAETFYAISPTPKDWPEKRALSFYREYNASMLAELTVHEAMPGHFLQIMHNNAFDSTVRAVFASGAFVEGWAVYSEWLMAKYGFGGPAVRLQRQKMVLRLAVNAILDHDVHAGAMDEKTALSLMMDEAFQEEGEAVGKWKRARLSSAQLTTYFYGFREMMKLRTAAEKQPGFTERKYHDRLLSYGSPPMRQIAEIMASQSP
jgi:uncharacterized protein (DUF885 family)